MKICQTYLVIFTAMCFAPLVADAQSTVDADHSVQAGKLDDVTSVASIRASQLIGMNIYNAEGESVGEINDIVLDAQHGKIRYAAVTYGGLFGLGDKLFAVPFEAFKCKREADDHDDCRMVLNVTQEQLEGAKGFDQNNWPDFADKNFTNDLDKRYGIERRMDRRADRRDRDGGVKVDVGPNGVDVDVDGDK